MGSWEGNGWFQAFSLKDKDCPCPIAITDVHYTYTDATQTLEKLVGVQANFAGWPEKLPSLLTREGICQVLPPSYYLSREMCSLAVPQRYSGSHCCLHSLYRGTQVIHELWSSQPTWPVQLTALEPAQLVPAHWQLVWVCLFAQQVPCLSQKP